MQIVEQLYINVNTFPIVYCHYYYIMYIFI